MPYDQTGLAGEFAGAFNDVAELVEASTNELERVSRVVGKEGKITQRAVLAGVSGGWAARIDVVNGLISDLVQPTADDLARQGDGTQLSAYQNALVEQSVRDLHWYTRKRMQPPPPTPAAPAPAVEEPQPPAVAWGLGAPDSGYPTPPPVNRRPEDDWPEMPQPGD